MRISRTTILLSIATVALLGAAAASPHLLGGHVASAFDALSEAERHWLLLGAAGFVTAFAATVGAWRAALAAAGGRICPKQAAARLAIGSMVNSFAPAKLGDAVKIALCSKAIDAPGRLWTAGGVYAALAAARSLALAAVIVVASASGAMPVWPVFVLCAMVGALVAVSTLSSRLRNHPRIAQVLDGLGALRRSPRALGSVLGWTALMQLARLGATMAVAAALGVPHPVLAALIILPALDVASAFPITPGSIGVGSGAVAVALATRGIGMTQALGVGFAIQGLETLVSITAGTAGLLYLAPRGPAVRRWSLRVGTVGASAGIAAGLGLLLAGAF
jgi:uncharacterized membrane protein YbhN (UPF0104 family)